MTTTMIPPNRRFTAFVAGREIRITRHNGTHARTFATAGQLGSWLSRNEYFLTNAPGTFRGVPEYCYVQYWGAQA